MSRIAVGVLRGGPSSEYDVSLETGKEVLRNLPKDKYVARDILITREGEWHLNGFPERLDRITRRVDVFFNALHGTYGEDGQVQRLLERYRVPYTGAGAFASALGMNKALAKEAFARYGLRVPRGVAVRRGDDIDRVLFEIYTQFPNPYIVKPIAAGSSVGLRVARTRDELRSAIEALLKDFSGALVEEYIRGREVTVGVIDSLEEGGAAYATDVIEIVKPDTMLVWGYRDKYSGETREVCPANFEPHRYRAIQSTAITAHAATGMRHYSRTDMIVTPRAIYVLEINSLPGLTAQSLLPKSLRHAGFQLSDFLDYLVTLALRKK